MYSELVKKHGARKGLSPRTLKTYAWCVDKFFRRCRKPAHKVTKQDILVHIDRLVEKRRASKTINVHVMALRFFFEQCLGRRLTVKVPTSKVRKRLPEFLEQSEVLRFLGVVRNEKHSLMLKLMYSAGLRVSEVVSLQVKDVEFDQNYFWVRGGKGGKDRAVPLAGSVREPLRLWIIKNGLKGTDWVFTGYNGKRYSVKSVQEIIKRARKKANIYKRITPHSLRHSFATHFLEQGNTLTDLQTLLGHSRLDTTMVYAHLAKPKMMDLKSPLDLLR